MKPVHQDKFGSPMGNCFMACVASILEIPLSDCPDLYELCGWEKNPESEEPSWWEISNRFVFEKSGKILVCCPISVFYGGYLPTGYTIASGPSPRIEGDNHACVALDGKIVHDPHPDNTGLPEIKTYDLFVPVLRYRVPSEDLKYYVGVDNEGGFK